MVQIIEIQNLFAKCTLSPLSGLGVCKTRKLYYKTNKQTNKQLEGKVSLARFISKFFNMPYAGLALSRSTDLWVNVLKCADQH